MRVLDILRRMEPNRMRQNKLQIGVQYIKEEEVTALKVRWMDDVDGPVGRLWDRVERNRSTR